MRRHSGCGQRGPSPANLVSQNWQIIVTVWLSPYVCLLNAPTLLLHCNALPENPGSMIYWSCWPHPKLSVYKWYVHMSPHHWISETVALGLWKSEWRSPRGRMLQKTVAKRLATWDAKYLNNGRLEAFKLVKLTSCVVRHENIFIDS